MAGGNFSYPGGRDIGEQTSSFDAFAAFQNWGSLALTDGVEPVRVEANYVDAAVFQFAGRENCDGTPDPARRKSVRKRGTSRGDELRILGTRQFGAAPDIIGPDDSFEPASGDGGRRDGWKSFDELWARFDGQAAPDVWVPLALSPELSGMFKPKDRDSAILCGQWRRLRPGVSIAQANQDLAAVAARAEKQYPATDRGFGIVRDSTSRSTGGPVLQCGVAVDRRIDIHFVDRLRERGESFAGAADRKAKGICGAIGTGRGKIAAGAASARRKSFADSIAAGALGLLFALGCIRGLNSWAHQNLPSIVRFLSRSLDAGGFDGRFVADRITFWRGPRSNGSRRWICGMR